MKIEIERDVLQNALEALQYAHATNRYDSTMQEKAIKELRKALASPTEMAETLLMNFDSAPFVQAQGCLSGFSATHPSQEPVGTVTSYYSPDCHTKWEFQPEAHAWEIQQNHRARERGARSCFSVYATPQQLEAREHLTDGQILNCGIEDQMWFAARFGPASSDVSNEYIRTHPDFSCHFVNFARSVIATNEDNKRNLK